MAFKRYSGRSRQKAKKNSTITITKNGHINLNSASSQMFEDFEYVDVFFDEEGEKIGIKPVDEKKEGTYTLIEQSGNYNAFTIGCTGFLKEFDISYKITTRYSASWDDDENILIANLENGEAVG